MSPARPAISSLEFTILMALLMSIVAISIDALLPALGVIGTDLQVTHPNHAQYIISVLFIGMSLGELIAGPCSDALGRKPVLFMGVGLFLIGSVICFFSPTLELMLVGRFIQGLGVACPYVSTVSIVRDKFSGREMAKVMSLVMMIFIMVPAIAPSLGQGIMYIASWRYVFVLYMAYAIVIALWLHFRLDETLPKEKRIPFHLPNILSGMKEVLKHPVTMSYILCMAACFGAFFGYLMTSQQIFQVQFGTGDMFVVYFGILALLLGVASLTNSRFVEKHGMRFMCICGFASVIAASTIFLAAHLLVEIKFWMFLSYAAVLFFSFGLVFGNLNALAMEPMGHIAGIAAAIIGAVSGVFSIALGTIIGQLYDNNLMPIVSGFLILGVFALFAMSYAEKKRKQLGIISDTRH